MQIEWDFEGGSDGFAYRDDAFRFTSEPRYAGGSTASSGGYGGSGAVQVRLGGVNDADISGMSGGWLRSFDLDEAQEVTLTFRYRMTQTDAYERNEYSEVLVAVDGTLVGPDGRDYVARIAGDGNGGASRSTGWRTAEIDLGELSAGRHTLNLGGFNNLKTDRHESTTLVFDDVALAGAALEGGTGGGTGVGLDLGAFEARVLELTNEFRAANGKAPLGNDAKLNVAAEDWSRSMAEGDFFRHSTPDQVEEQGYQWRAWGENIAVGYRTPESVVQGWINSSGHRANMLSDKFQEIGVGHVYLAEDTGQVNYGHYWTQVFGTEASDQLFA